jgi:arsenate reductase
MEIWINPECSKCQSALTILDAEQADYTIRYYLEQPPTVEELHNVLARLELEPWDIARLSEASAGQLGLATWPRDATSRTQWIAALAAHPVLIQRPIITADDAASIARSPEAIHAALRRTTATRTPSVAYSPPST